MRRLRSEVPLVARCGTLVRLFRQDRQRALGQIYDWMYCTCPVGSSSARDRSFFYIGHAGLCDSHPHRSGERVRTWASGELTYTFMHGWCGRGAALGLVGVVALSAWSVVVLQSGSLGFHHQPHTGTHFILSPVAAPGCGQPSRTLLWFGQPPHRRQTFTTTHFLVASPTHPAGQSHRQVRPETRGEFNVIHSSCTVPTI